MDREFPATPAKFRLSMKLPGAGGWPTSPTGGQPTMRNAARRRQKK